ncbi:MAG: ABC transporter permease, partial [Flavobacteriaceae bacterium]|nr:ABC transporter permease [Flavobacteriaceae bacterium]
FIRAPFVLRSMRLGFTGAILAIIGLGVVVYYLNQSFPELALFNEPILLAAIAGGVLLIGLLIVWISTWLATQRYLNLKADALY